MNLRPLIIDDELRWEIDRIKCYAEEHHYIPGPGVPPPGQNPHHVLRTDFGYRVVFSMTNSDGVIWRHMSISVPNERLPNPSVTFTIAELFGFIGWDQTPDKPPRDWLVHLEKETNAIVLAQIVSPEKPTGAVH